MNKSRCYYWVLFSIILLSPLSNLKAQNPVWNTIRSGDYHYQIMFPTLPQEVFKNVSEGLKITTYAPFREATYFTKILVLKTKPNDPVAKAKKTLNSLATKMGGKLVDEEEWKYDDDHLGIYGQIDIPDGGEGKPQMTIQSRVIVVDKIQYQMMVLVPTSSYDHEVAGRFFGSFQLL